MKAEKETKEVNERDIRFFKQGGLWYADVPNHTLEENLMVSGADDLIEAVSSGLNEVTVGVAWPNYEGKDWLFRLSRTSHNQHGATYEVSLSDSVKPLAEAGVIPRTAWICNVTHDVLGGHPESIYILSVKSAA